jgi:hypothetical protein
MSPELPKSDECTPEVQFVVRWWSPVAKEWLSQTRRVQLDAIELAKKQKKAGFKTRLFRIETTEIDF